MNYDILLNKNVFVTGASGGIGQEIASSYAKKGCNLFLTGQNLQKLDQVTESLRTYGTSVHCYSADLTDKNQVDVLISEARKKLGHIDILVNCAGVFYIKSLEQTTLQDFNQCLNINIIAPFLLTKGFIGDMINKKWGRIVNIGSSSSYDGFANTSAYCSSKHGLLGFSRSLSSEFKDKNIRTFCLSPGSVKTKMGKQIQNQDFETFIDPEEIAEYVVFVTSFNSEMISDEILMKRVNLQ
tara:strand:+ start:115 stop:834 length:720 start_codon:yes stop_codon:yes gene_type:complete